MARHRPQRFDDETTTSETDLESEIWGEVFEPLSDLARLRGR